MGAWRCGRTPVRPQIQTATFITSEHRVYDNKQRGAHETFRLIYLILLFSSVAVLGGRHHLPRSEVSVAAGQLEHSQTWRRLSLASSRGGGALNTYMWPPAPACEKCGAQVRNRNERLVITPSGTTGGGFSPIPRGPEVSVLHFLSINRSIK